MYLFWTEIIHLAAGLIIGGLLYYKYRQRQLFFLCLGVSIFIDLDHLIDYFLYADFTRFSLAEFLTVGFAEKNGRAYFIFHGWEWVILLLFLVYLFKKYQQLILLTIGLAVFGHLLVDQFTNEVGIFTYSFIYRLINNFSYSGFRGI